MSKIVTITFNPCLDKSASVPTLIPEKKLSCSEPRFEPGGGAVNVARAIKKSGGNIGLVIMDMVLPGSDGTDMCRRLKNDKRTSSIPVLMFSAHPTTKEACLSEGQTILFQSHSG